MLIAACVVGGYLAVGVVVSVAVGRYLGRVSAHYPLADCECGHPYDMHEHYRDGTDCGRCGSEKCERYQAKVVAK